MKSSLLMFMLTLASGLAHRACGQGWHAEIHLEVGNEIVTVENVSVSLSGFTVFDNSRSIMDLTINGQGPLPTLMSVYVSGYADAPGGATVDLHAEYGLQNLTPCAADRFLIATENGRVWGSIVVYPQLKIKTSSPVCGNISLSTPICGGKYYWIWEVSNHALGPFVTLPEKTASINVTSQGLEDLGLPGYGRKFFRVSSAPGTTSNIAVVDLPYPAPVASFTLTPPKCHGGDDGAIAVNITSAHPDVINDFIVTLSGNGLVKQEVLNNSNVVRISGLTAGNYHVKIENNSNIALYGSCSRSYQPGPLIEPEAIKLQAVSISNKNGFNIGCHGDNDGFIETEARGGSGMYRDYTWTPDVSKASRASGLAAGTYSVKVTDSNNCESAPVTISLSEPDRLQLQLTSTGGQGGFGVSCYDKSDGVITASVSGGVPSYRYLWEDGTSKNPIENLSTGIYALTVSDANGCTIAGSYSLAAPDPIAFQLNELSGIQCAGQQTGALIVHNVRNTIGSMYYNWSSGETSKDITDKGAGTYSVTVSDDQGCEATQSYTLEEPAAWSVDLIPTPGYNDEAIRCDAESDGVLTALVTDGEQHVTTAQYYEWYKDGEELMTGAEAKSADELGAGTYTVRITYHTYCFAEQSFVLEAQEPPVLDLGGSATVCRGQAHILDAGPRWKSLAWAGSTGFESDEQRISLTEAGRYWVEAVRDNGCVVRDTFDLRTAADLLNANFLLPSTVSVGDTVVIIDVSWPLPERITWQLPEAMNKLTDSSEIVSGTFIDTGEYDVVLTATLGECQDGMVKRIVVLPRPEQANSDHLFGHESFVTAFSQYPNPNDGVFDVDVEFSEESHMVLTVWNTLSMQKIVQFEDYGKRTYSRHFDLRPLSPGHYALRLDHDRGTVYWRFVVR